MKCVINNNNNKTIIKKKDMLMYRFFNGTSVGRINSIDYVRQQSKNNIFVCSSKIGEQSIKHNMPV